jgi:hypothetical protein
MGWLPLTWQDRLIRTMLTRMEGRG